MKKSELQEYIKEEIIDILTQAEAMVAVNKQTMANDPSLKGKDPEAVKAAIAQARKTNDPVIVPEDEDDDAYKAAGKEKGIAAQASSDLKKQQQMAKIQDFIKKMQGMGIIDKDKKIIDKEAYKKEFSKLKNVR